MMNTKIRTILGLLIFVLILVVSFSCGEDDPSAGPGQGDDDTAADDDDDDDSSVDDDDVTAQCDATKTPIVFVHGMVDAGDTFANSAMRFASNGYCSDRIFAFDWNTISFDYGVQSADLALFINEVLNITGSDRIDLVGHSAGGMLSRIFLSAPQNAAKVAHYANLASFGGNAPVGIPTINISSEYDAVMGASHMEGAQNLLLEGTDHLQVVSCVESFKALYRFFNEGTDPVTSNIVPEANITLSGRIVSLDENAFGVGYTVKIYEFDPETGQRIFDEPFAEFIGDEGGYFGPFNGTNDSYYEFWVIPTDSSEVSVHYYREPQPRSNHLIYLRTLPGGMSVFGVMLQVLLPLDNESTAAVSFTANQSTVAGRDTLFVDGYEMSKEGITSVKQSTIAIFLTDVNRNGISDEASPDGLLGLVIGTFPLLQSFDLLIPSTPKRIIPFTFNGRTINVPNLMSKSEGVVIPVFD